MKKVAILAALQLGVILAGAGYHENVRAHAPTFRIPLHPADPYDRFRGRYFALGPLDSRLKTGRPDTYLTAAAVARFMGSERMYQGPLLVAFCAVGDVHRVCDLRRVVEPAPAPDGRFWSRARGVVAWEEMNYRDGKQVPEAGWWVSLNLDLDRFFLPNRFPLPGRETDPGWELEVSHRPGQPLLPKRLWFRGEPLRTESRGRSPSASTSPPGPRSTASRGARSAAGPDPSAA